MAGIILLHGLPGAGKTTLCTQLAELRSDVFYANLASSKDFGIKDMAEIAADMYEEANTTAWLLTEGWLPKLAARDNFARKISRRLVEKNLPRPTAIHVIYMSEASSETLASRRRRTVEEYEEMRQAIEVGSDRHQYWIFECSLSESVLERTLRFNEMVSRIVSGNGAEGEAEERERL